MKNIIRITFLLLICVAFVSKIRAEEFITLTSKIEASEFYLSDNNLGEYNNDWDAAYEDLVVKAKDYVSKDEDILKLKKGETVELISMFGANSAMPEEPTVPSLSDTNYTWYVNNDIYQGGFKLEVKFPSLETWFELKYNSKYQNNWNGLGTMNPVIVGPCELKLTRYAWTVLMYMNTSSNTPLRRFGIRHTGGIVWAFLKKRNASDSSNKSSLSAQSIVLPEGSGDLTIIMEGSNDLINWTREDLGKKTEGNRKTFYRIRAVKE